MIIENFRPFTGNHCETTATGSLLRQLGIELSEPMLFGLGQGLGYIFWNMKAMDYPFIGGRIKPDMLTLNIAESLNLALEVQETASVKKAWEQIKGNIDNGIATGLKLDCYHLEYFATKIHFAAHYVTMYGYDSIYVYLADTMQQGSNTKTSLKSLELARNEKGPMSSKNLSYTIRRTERTFEQRKAIISAIKNNAESYLNAPISNMGYRGILRTAKEIRIWFEKSRNIEHEFGTTAMLMEQGGTGGALFRGFYRDFLKESYDLLKIGQLREGWEMFSEIARLWEQVSYLFKMTASTRDIRHINKAATILADLSQKEKSAMELLLTL